MTTKFKVTVALWLITVVGWALHFGFCMNANHKFMAAVGTLVLPLGVIHGYGRLFGIFPW